MSRAKAVLFVWISVYCCIIEVAESLKVCMFIMLGSFLSYLYKTVPLIVLFFCRKVIYQILTVNLSFWFIFAHCVFQLSYFCLSQFLKYMLFVCLFETRSLLVSKRLVWPATLRTSLSLPLQHWDYRHEATHLALPMWVLQMGLSSSVFQSKYSTSWAIFPTWQLSNNDHKVVFSTYVNICGS